MVSPLPPIYLKPNQVERQNSNQDKQYHIYILGLKGRQIDARLSATKDQKSREIK